MKLNIMTWNTALSEIPDCCADHYKVDVIIQYIKDFLDRENAIAVLQEMPYRENRGGQWIETNVYHKVRQAFAGNAPDETYQYLCNQEHHQGHLRMMTVVITKMRNVALAEDGYYSTPKRNRECAVTVTAENRQFVLLGVHAELGAEHLMHFRDNQADIILGDFNAGDYNKSKLREIFNAMLRDTHTCICNEPTREYWVGGILERISHIDHIFVRHGLEQACTGMQVHKHIKFSAHYPITFEVNI